MRGRSSSPVDVRLRSIRAEALRAGRRVFQLVEVAGVRVESPVVRGEYRTVVEALDAARRFCVSTCVVREWAILPQGVRVHVDSVEWLLSWTRVDGLRCPQAAKGRADSTGEALAPQPVGRERSVPRSDVNQSMSF